MARKAKTKPPLISILIPVFNEERNVSIAYEAVVKLFETLNNQYRYEIVFSDNKSTDGTADELKRLAAKDPNVKVIFLARNFGFQKSVLTAYRHASGDAAVQIDCDLQDSPDLIPEFLSKWEEGHDVVVGIRKVRQESLVLQMMRRFYYRLVSAISNDNILANAGDFRLVDRSVIEQLKIIDDANPYTRGLVSSLAANQVGIEYAREERKFEKSKFPVHRLTGLATDGIVSHSLAPLRLASFVGIMIFVASMVVAAYYILGFLIGGRAWPAGFTTLVLLLLMSVGLNAVLLGILGEYVGRIYEQVRTRPITVIENTINMESSKKGGNSSS